MRNKSCERRQNIRLLSDLNGTSAATLLLGDSIIPPATSLHKAFENVAV